MRNAATLLYLSMLLRRLHTLPVSVGFVVTNKSSKLQSLIKYSLNAKPKRAGTKVDSYQTVSVNCNKCSLRLFRYKKKNGTKSNLVKCYVERIVEDSASVLGSQPSAETFTCPGCGSGFARPATIKGLPALKLVGGKIRMSKK